MRDETVFLVRQPILNKNEEIVGYELLFRSGDINTTEIADVGHASASVIANALTQFGMEAVLSQGKGFVNVDQEMLLSDAIELLPKESVVLALLKTVNMTESVIQRSGELKDKGFSLALDGFGDHPLPLPLLELVDFVKMDAVQGMAGDLQKTIQQIKKWPIQLLAVRVETQEAYQTCRQLGFNLFQGYYFARPSILSRKRIDPAMVSLTKLLEKVMQDADTQEIEQIFKENPSLSYNLLRLVNSVSVGARQKIKTISHAITMLGRQQLKRWVQLLLFTQGSKGGMNNPLLQTAVLRARSMELLVQLRTDRYPERGYSELAFMTGILSLIDVLLGVSMEEAVDQLNLIDDVRQALLAREGSLGLLLSLIERQEEADFKGVERFMKQAGLKLSDLLSAQREAISWIHRLTSSF